VAFVEIRELSKSYWLHGTRIDVLRGLSLDIGAASWSAWWEPRAREEHTFLHVLGTLDAPVAGR
jgi:lipoprotein-releasing system ATP-binding protein